MDLYINPETGQMLDRLPPDIRIRAAEAIDTLMDVDPREASDPVNDTQGIYVHKALGWVMHVLVTRTEQGQDIAVVLMIALDMPWNQPAHQPHW